MKHNILDPSFIKRLERLSLLSKKIFAGKVQSVRRSAHKGHSAEFFDYRSYEQGDDLRYIDINIFARLEKLLIKLFVAEEELSLNILVDNSRSMCCPTDEKLLYAKKIAAALAYISISNLDRVGISTFSQDLNVRVLPSRGKKHFFTCLRYLDEVSEDSGTNVNKALVDFANTMNMPGVVVIISDFFDSGGYERGLNYLKYKKYDVNVIQVISPSELNIDLQGDLRLVDAENGGYIDVTATKSLTDAYNQRLAKLCDDMELFCKKRGITRLRTLTSGNFEDLILNYFKVKGMIKSK